MAQALSIQKNFQIGVKSYFNILMQILATGRNIKEFTQVNGESILSEHFHCDYSI